MGGLAWPPTVSSHHPRLPNQDPREKLEDCIVGNQEAEGQGPHRGSGKAWRKVSREGTQGLAVEGLEVNLPVRGGTKGTPVCAVTPRDVRGPVMASRVENRG